MTGVVDWTWWSVILLKPDCVARDLVEPVLAQVSTDITVVDRRIVTAAEDQILAHYADLLTIWQTHFTWVDVASDLRREYAGHHVGIALAYGKDAAPRLRNQLGHYDPTRAAPDSLRGRFGRDCLTQAQTEHRLIRNVIHSSDDLVGAEREFGIWYGPAFRHLLQPPRTSSCKEPPR
jgi:nucleoside-diphosphate kinase